MFAHAKKRKVGNECHVFNKTWTSKNIKGKAVCFICGTRVAVLKYYNLNHHHMTKNIYTEVCLKRTSLRPCQQNCPPNFVTRRTKQVRNLLMEGWRSLIGLCCTDVAGEKGCIWEHATVPMYGKSNKQIVPPSLTHLQPHCLGGGGGGVLIQSSKQQSIVEMTAEFDPRCIGSTFSNTLHICFYAM